MKSCRAAWGQGGHMRSLIKKKIKLSSYIYKEIQNGAVAKSYMTNGLLIYGEKYLRISSYIRKLFLIYDFATAPL